MMLSPLSSVGAAIAGPLLERTVDTVTGGLSFLRQLATADEPAVDEVDSASDEPPATLAEQLAAFQKLLAERLTAEGLDAGTPFELYVDDFGEVAVDDHPDRLFIEHLFSHDSDLRAAFFELAREGEIVRYEAV